MSSQKIKDIGEFGLIHLIRRCVPRLCQTVKGIGDDAAVMKISSGKRLLLTADMLVEDVHFKLSIPHRAIGWKSLCCSISDIAAMGGEPRHAVVSLGIPPGLKRKVIDAVYDGIFDAAKKFHIDIVGGDTVKSDKVIINVALTGEVEPSRVVYRGGAKSGDKIFVTGPLGNSFKSGWHLRFVPRVNEARFLVEKFKPTAMIDISDGLAGDLGHILEESKVGAVIEANRVPLRRGATVDGAFHDGEDFELLFTLPLASAEKLLKTKRFPFYSIGEIVPKRQGLNLRLLSGKTFQIKPKGFAHF